MSYFKFENKNVFYNVVNEGQPLLLLHGNAASSKMFELVLPLYTKDFQVIVLDFLGHGASERVDVFPVDMYEWQAEQVIALLDHLHLGKVSIVGTSGGAWVAINVALKRNDLVHKVVADSFDGRRFATDFAKQLENERRFAKFDTEAIQFYEWCQGNDWERIVDLDTNALLSLAHSQYLFCMPIEELKVPLLMLGSKEDEMCRSDLQEEYAFLSSIIASAEMQIFETGKHPLILTHATEVSRQIKNYLAQ